MKVSQFEKQIDKWVLASINSGVLTFDKLVISLPGIYPSLVLNSISSLVQKGKIKKEFLKKTLKYVQYKEKNSSNGKNLLNTPHPLDFEWRFTADTVNNLLRKAHQLTNSGDTIALLGTPSLYHGNLSKFRNKKIVFLDKNSYHLKKKTKNTPFHQCDFFKDKLPSVNAKLIVADPPWYPDYFRAFIWTCSKLCSKNGQLLISMPLIGTRPGISKERKKIMKWMESAGFEKKNTLKNFIIYNSPLFERNALRGEGIYQVPLDWRHADLHVFLKSKISKFKRPKITKLNNWEKINVSGIELRVRKSHSKKFSDPCLISIIDGDILPSVSSRDERRKLVKFWTGGNRIFDCKGLNVLILILKALAKKSSPYNEIATFLGRTLTKKECSNIANTVNQISVLVRLECKEAGIKIVN